MDAKHWTGSDERPELAPDPIEACPDCGAEVDEPCDPACRCIHCQRAGVVLAAPSKDAA